jgi:hypothetical protein
MNRGRTNLNYLISRPIHPVWLLGFIEGEGSFHITQGDLGCVFSLSQDKISMSLMQLIVEYFNDLCNPIKPFKLEIENNTKMVKVRIKDIESLFHHLIPFLDKLTWHSRKRVDFEWWIKAVQLKRIGYGTTVQGKALIKAIGLGINSNRYSNSKTSYELPDVTTVDNLISKPLFSLKPGTYRSCIAVLNNANRKNKSE